MIIQKNDTQYKEEGIKDLCDEGRSSETDATIVDLLERTSF